ncbi:DUF6009 family protein [Nocardia sp. CY41]|uniref:DUF6009 family protein n=1 Tax=Nocardia sp. CY41 TaxID=2608686 RepID=UPI0019165DBB|nr:DUF6009 family protein [Nocardia sp. CY41]
MTATIERIAGEDAIVWLDNLERYDYVRESLNHWVPRRGGRIRWPHGRLVGYAELRRDAAPWMAADSLGPAAFARRVFWVKEYDRSEQPNDIYAVGCPIEAVDPRTVAPGVLGDKTTRAWGCTCFDASHPFPGRCHDCHTRRVTTLRTGIAVKGHHPTRKA